MDLQNAQARLYQSGLVVIYRGNGGTRDTKRMLQRAQIKRTFAIRATKVKSACLALWKNRKNRSLLFVTVTDPYESTEEDLAKAWRNWLKNIGKNRKIRGYVWVKERQKNGKIHYHILFDAAYINVQYMQKAWEAAFFNATGREHYTHNSVRLGERPVVNSIDKVAGYLVPYFIKTATDDEERSRSDRKYFGSGSRKYVERFERRAYGFTGSLELFRELDPIELIEFLRSQGSPGTKWLSIESFSIVGWIDPKHVDLVFSQAKLEVRPPPDIYPGKAISQPAEYQSESAAQIADLCAQHRLPLRITLN